mgnify:CR=1 FL=1
MFSSRPKPIRFDTPEKEKPRRMELFPQYSTPLPEFEGETIDMHTMKPVRPREMSDGTPRTVAMSPELHASFTDLVKSHSDSSKVIPLHVQTDETEEEMEAYIPERPEDFTPMRSPNPRSPYLSKLGMESSRRHLTKESKAPGPMFEMPRARDLKIPNSWKKWRLYFLLFLFLGLLLGIILLPLWASGKLNNNNTTETTPSSSLSASTANNGGGIDTGSLNGTTSWFTPGGKDAKQPDFLGNSEPPSIAPITTATPTTAPPLILQPTAPINAPSSNKINTPVPTLNDGSHRLIPILSPHVPMDTLLDPNSFAGEALIWLVDKDLQLEGVNSERRIIQRFALTVLDVALHHPKPRAWSSRNMHECRWPGVTCDGQRWVTGINWAEQNLQGILPSELGLLTQLTSVDVAQNQLKGTLESLYTLESLEHAILFENQLTGPALTEQVQKLGNLTKLMIGHNQLTGTIPSGVRMRPLRWLVLHHNQVSCYYVSVFKIKILVAMKSYILTCIYFCLL